MKRITLLALLLTVTSGCRSVCHREELNALPKNRGFYGGSLWSYAWVYRFSDETTHHFQYAYHIDNTVHRKHIMIPKLEITMSGMPIRDKKGYTPARPVLDAAGQITGFTPEPEHKLDFRTTVPKSDPKPPDSP
ncbi:MAG: hypothetical protein V1809_10055 [Planctomycetota bacterium]